MDGLAQDGRVAGCRRLINSQITGRERMGGGKRTWPGGTRSDENTRPSRPGKAKREGDTHSHRSLEDSEEEEEGEEEEEEDDDDGLDIGRFGRTLGWVREARRRA